MDLQKVRYLDDTNEKTTYSDILKWSIRTAIKLRKLGISPKDIISCCSHNQKYSPVVFIATQFIGGVCSNFDPKLSRLDTIHLLKLIQPKIMFVASESLNFIEDCLEKACVSTEIVVFGPSDKYRQFSEFLEVSKKEEESFQIEHIENNTDTAVIFFSSGTTGFPKGICLNHKTFLKFTKSTKGFTDNEDNNNEVFMLFTTFYWVSAAYFLIRTIRYGFSSVVRANFEPEYTWKLIEKYKVTSMFLAPYHAVDFVNNKPSKVNSESLKTFFTGSCHVSLKLMQSLIEAVPHAKVYHVYGQTETGCIISMFTDDYEMQLRKPLSCGKIVEDIQWKVVDVNTEKPLGPNESGELRLKNDGYFMNGYYKMDSSSAFDFEGYLKTGDLVYYDEEDCLYIIDRVKEIFKYRGWHILPNILEEIVLSHPAVKEAAVIGIPHEIDGEHPMAAVVLFNEFDKNCAKEIEEFVNEKVADSQKLRAGVRILDSLPKTPTNKIKRNELKRMIIKMMGNM